MNNTTTNYCGLSCELPELRYSLISVNAVSVLLKVLHVYILSNMKQLRRSRYYDILVHLSVSDVFYALEVTGQLVFYKPHYFERMSRVAFVFSYGLHGFAMRIRYWIMAAGSLERYFAICQPTSYTTSRFITRIRIWLVLIWLAAYGLALVQTVTTPEEVCYSELVGPLLDSEWVHVGVYIASLAIPGLMTAMLLGRVSVEVYRMKKNRSLTDSEKVLRSTANYLIAVSVLLYMGLIPPLATGVMLSTCYSCFEYVGPVYYTQITFTCVYGIVNVFVYGFMTPAYRKPVSLFISTPVKVEPTP